ncbi:MAG: precorrin-8X methylmutase [Deltaproteobacteria bacterium]|jgi:precorrin-8X/cobalt-precorrin-8 methylmutase|nr:precorrin-8X methylmutase [Deltaproteobacteria bacterium]
MTSSWQLSPAEIEQKSFAIIDLEAGAHDWAPPAWSLVRRLIHTSADFDYVRDTVISEGALAAGVSAIKDGASIITDTRMALNGINRKNLLPFGNEIFCFIDNTKTLEKAKVGTRSQAAVEVGLSEVKNPAGIIWVIGNAPTALYRLLEILADPLVPKPRLILGFPVGFVNALESKTDLHKQKPAPYITNLSRKGGSNIAAAAVNALACLANG